MSLLLKAVEESNPEQVANLLKDPNVDLSDSQLLVSRACSKKNIDIVRLLLEDGRIDPSAQNNAAIREAATNRNTEIAKVLLADKRVNPGDRDNEALRKAVENRNKEMVQLLLSLNDERIDLSANDNEVIKRSATFPDTDILKMLLEDKRSDPKRHGDEILAYAIKGKNLKAVQCILSDGRIDPGSQSTKFVEYAAQIGSLDIIKELLKDKRVNPAVNNNALFIKWAKESKSKWVALLLEDARVNPGVNDNEVLRRAAKRGDIKIVNLLLNHPDKRIDPAARMGQAILLAASKGNDDIVELLFDRSHFLGLPFSQIFDKNAPNLSEKIAEFAEDPIAYFETKAKNNLSLAQLEAIQIILLNKKVEMMEQAQKMKIANDPESAMQDSQVVAAMQFFQKVIKPHFQDQFMRYGEPGKDEAEIQKKALLAIEKEIRNMLLDEMIAKSNNVEFNEYIKTHKDALTTGNDESLLKEVREKYLNSKTNPLHIAWRAYDRFAPTKGYDNLCVEPLVETNIFSTSRTGGPVTNKTASNVVRERIAYYYQLVMDKNDGAGGSEKDIKERIENRKANFILELADLMRAHSMDHAKEPDAPSCFPGYIGRIANLGYEHPLAKEGVTTKLMVGDIMRPIILDNFTESLKGKSSEEECENLLKSLSNLTERLGYAQDVLLRRVDYTDDLLKTRKDFIASLGDINDMIETVNEELKKRGHEELQNLYDMEEDLFVNQYVMDPSRAQMLGYLGNAYTNYVNTHFKIAEEKQQIISTLSNPFQSNYENISKLFKNSPALGQSRLRKAQAQIDTFNKLEQLMNKHFTKEEMIDNRKGLSLFLELITNTIFENDLQEENTEAAFNNIMENEPYKSEFKEKVNNATEREEYPQAFALSERFVKQADSSKLKH